MTTVRSGASQIDWKTHGNDRIAQNVRNLINTYRYEIPYHRTMGLPGNFVDRPVNVLMEEAKVEVAQMLAIYEPRANIKDIRCSLSPGGTVEVEVILE